MTRNMAQTMPAAPGGAAGSAPVVPLGYTTVLSSDDLMRIRTTLLHADANTRGTEIKSEVSGMFVGVPCAVRFPSDSLLGTPLMSRQFVCSIQPFLTVVR